MKRNSNNYINKKELKINKLPHLNFFNKSFINKSFILKLFFLGKIPFTLICFFPRLEELIFLEFLVVEFKLL